MHQILAVQQSEESLNSQEIRVYTKVEIVTKLE